MRHREPKILGLLALAAVALLGAGLFGYVTVRDTAGTSDRASASPASVAARSGAAVPTKAFVSRAGGYALRVPTDLAVTQSGPTARFTSPGKDLVVSVGPISGGPLRAATRSFLRTLRQGYPRLALLGRQQERVDGRAALTVYGQVRNDKGVPLRFVVVIVAAHPRSFALTAFTAHDSDPTAVLPRVDAIVNSFHVSSRR